jgi:F-type H+-transporting ATPase subunit gamma
VASIRALRNRIRSISNLSQVTRAMEMVAASRMRRAQEQVRASRPYAAKAWELLTHLREHAVSEEQHPLLIGRDEAGPVLLVLVTGDRGLAGAYNSQILRAAVEFLSLADAASSSTDATRIITVGRKGRDFMVRNGFNVVAEFGGLPDRPTELDVAPVGRLAVEEFLSGAVGSVFIAYTDFVNVLRQEPWVRRLLPIQAEGAWHNASGNEPNDNADPAGGSRQPVMAQYLRERPAALAGGYTYEPTPELLLEAIVRRFVELQIYQGVVEALASEHAARMVAMRNATDNANELVGDLRVAYNKLRQESITTEMLDIAGGAEALSKSIAGPRSR